MAEYIEREAALDIVKRTSGDYAAAFTEIAHIPASDVTPVRHGHWVYKHRHRGGFRIYEGYDEFGEKHRITVDERIELDEPYCSECGKWNESAFLNYCPNCGAKMEGN